MSLLDDVLNTSADTVEDVPEFLTPPVGRYKATVAVSAKEIDVTNKETKLKEATPVVECTYCITEVVETAGLAPAVGSLFSESFFLSRPEFFKRYAKSILGDDVAGKTLGELIQAINGLALEMSVTNRESKGNTYAGTRDHVVI